LQFLLLGKLIFSPFPTQTFIGVRIQGALHFYRQAKGFTGRESPITLPADPTDLLRPFRAIASHGGPIPRGTPFKLKKIGYGMLLAKTDQQKQNDQLCDLGPDHAADPIDFQSFSRWDNNRKVRGSAAREPGAKLGALPERSYPIVKRFLPEVDTLDRPAGQEFGKWHNYYLLEVNGAENLWLPAAEGYHFLAL
jgi:hypothetical protein